MCPFSFLLAFCLEFHLLPCCSLCCKLRLIFIFQQDQPLVVAKKFPSFVSHTSFSMSVFVRPFLAFRSSCVFSGCHQFRSFPFLIILAFLFLQFNFPQWQMFRCQEQGWIRTNLYNYLVCFFFTRFSFEDELLPWFELL